MSESFRFGLYGIHAGLNLFGAVNHIRIGLCKTPCKQVSVGKHPADFPAYCLRVVSLALFDTVLHKLQNEVRGYVVREENNGKTCTRPDSDIKP